MNHQGLRWNVHCVTNVGLRKRLNLCKRGFKIYDLLVFIFFSVSRGLDLHSGVPKIAVNHATWDVYSPKLLKHAYMDSITNTVFFMVCKIFSFGVLEAFDLKGKLNKPKRYYVSHGMRWRCKFHFRYVTDKILFTLQVYSARSVSHKFSEYFPQFLTREQNCRALLLKQV